MPKATLKRLLPIAFQLAVLSLSVTGGSSGTLPSLQPATAAAATTVQNIDGTFNGTSTYVALPVNTIKQSTSLTFEAWFKTTSPGVILGYQDTAAVATPASNWIPAVHVDSYGVLRGEFWNGANNAMTSATSVNDGNWHHVALVGNSNTQSLYVDGILAGTRAGTIQHLNMSYNQIGTGYTKLWQPTNQTWSYFNGTMDQVRVWTVARTETDIRANMHRALTGAETGIVTLLASNRRPNDTTAPAISAFSIPQTAKSLTVSISQLTATDNVGVNGYLLTTSAITPTAFDAGWSVTKPTSYTFTASGTNTLYAWVKDAGGNISAAASAAVTIDISAPTISAFDIPAITTSLTVPISTLTAIDSSGIAGYCLTQVYNSAGCVWSETKPLNYTFGSIPDGVATARTLYAWVKDAAGNVSVTYDSTVITLPDVTAPTITTFSIPTIATSRTIPVTSFTVTDNVAVSGYCLTETNDSAGCVWNGLKPGSYTFNDIPDGIATARALYAWSRDAAANVSSGFADSITITLPDVTAPTISAFVVPANSSGTTVAIDSFVATDNVGISAYCLGEIDNPAGCQWLAAKPSTFTFNSLASTSLYAWVKDAAGNVSSSRQAFIDMIPPTIGTATATPPAGATGVLPDKTVSVTFSEAMDPASLTPSSFCLVGVSGTVSYDPASRTATFIPDSPLNFETTYNVIITADVRDAAGNALSSGTAWNFTTIAFPKPVKMTIPATALFSSVIDLLQSPMAGDVTVLVQAVSLNGDHLFARDLAVTLHGGYDSDFAGVTGTTGIRGVLIVGLGSLTVENLSIL